MIFILSKNLFDFFHTKENIHLTNNFKEKLLFNSTREKPFGDSLFRNQTATDLMRTAVESNVILFILPLSLVKSKIKKCYF